MQTTTLGKTGFTVSQLGFGAAPMGYLETEQQQVQKVVGFLLDSGVNLIDTAACYAGSEQALGPALGSRRDEVVLVSKCGHAAGLDSPAWEPRTIHASIDRSLRRLQTDVIDVMLLHSCDLCVLEKGEAMGALVEARDAGKVRFAGYSGDNEAAVYAAGLEEVAVVEMSVSMCDQHNLEAALPRCRSRNLGVLAKRPIANAAWKELSTQPGMYQNYAADYTRRLAAMNITPLELGYSGHTEVEWPEVALKFTLAQEGVHTAIVGTTSQTSAKINVQAAQKNPMREQAVQALHQAFERGQKESGETWRGLG